MIFLNIILIHCFRRLIRILVLTLLWLINCSLFLGIMPFWYVRALRCFISAFIKKIIKGFKALMNLKKLLIHVKMLVLGDILFISKDYIIFDWFSLIFIIYILNIYEMSWDKISLYLLHFSLYSSSHFILQYIFDSDWQGDPLLAWHFLFLELYLYIFHHGNSQEDYLKLIQTIYYIHLKWI